MIIKKPNSWIKFMTSIEEIYILERQGLGLSLNRNKARARREYTIKEIIKEW